MLSQSVFRSLSNARSAVASVQTGVGLQKVGQVFRNPNGCRQFGRSSIVCCEQTTGRIGNFHHPSNFDKKVLVWTKFYPSIEAIPKTVSYSKMTKAKDWFRIYVSIGMIVFAAVGGGLMMYSGHRARLRGDSVTKIGLEFQQRMQEQGRQEREQAKNSSEAND